MIAGSSIDASSLDAVEPSFSQESCCAFLAGTQNSDGGWGFNPAAGSAVEATCWAVLALDAANRDASSDFRQPIQKAKHWLCAAQLNDGSWPAYSSQNTGCWLTSMAVIALSADSEFSGAVAKAARWVCDSWPAEGGLWWRFRQWVRPGLGNAGHDSSIRGWSWTPETASWVEPTALSLLCLKHLPSERLPKSAARRIEIGEAMLFDRMCPGGGWNMGNPMVYNVAGEPLVGPTVWALLATSDRRENSANQQSIEWLESVYAGIQGPGSLALAHMCLREYGLTPPPLAAALHEHYSRNEFLRSINVMSWSVLALSDLPRWLPASHKEGRP